MQVNLLREWVRSAHADIMLAEILAGRALHDGEDVAGATDGTVVFDAESGSPQLKQPRGAQFVMRMRSALNDTPLASQRLRALCKSIVDSVQRRVEILDRIKVQTTHCGARCVEISIAAVMSQQDECWNRLYVNCGSFVIIKSDSVVGLHVPPVGRPPCVGRLQHQSVHRFYSRATCPPCVACFGCCRPLS